MTLYNWQNDLIESLHIVHDQKYPTAFLQVSDQIGYDQRKAWVEGLQGLGLQTSADKDGDKYVLRIRGFESDSEILSDLQKADIMHNKFSNVSHDDEPDDKSHGVAGFKKWVADNSMVASGISYLTADALAFMSGKVRDDVHGMRQGAIWASTSVMLVLFGTRDPKQQMENLYAKMDEHFRKEGIDLDSDKAYMLAKLKGNPDFFYNKLKNFIYEHPVEINNSLQGLGGVNLIRAGINQKRIKFNHNNPLEIGHGKPNWFKVAAGISVTFGQWAAMFIDEEPDVALSEKEKQQRFMDRLEGKEVEEPESISPFQNPWKWVKQKPLRITGLGAGINNMFIQASALGYERMDLNHYNPDLARNYLPGVKQETKEGSVKYRFEQAEKAEMERISKMAIGDARSDARSAIRETVRNFEAFDKDQIKRSKGLMYDQFTPAPNLIANYLYGMSPKDRRGFLKEDGYLEELYTMAANIFAGMPEELRAERINKFAGYMANQPDMKSSSKEIEGAVLERIEQLKDNPWLEQKDEPEKGDDTPDTNADHIAHVSKGVLSDHAAALAPVSV